MLDNNDVLDIIDVIGAQLGQDKILSIVPHPPQYIVSLRVFFLCDFTTLFSFDFMNVFTCWTSGSWNLLTTRSKLNV